MEAVHLRGEPIHLCGPMPLVGARAPAFTLTTKDFKEWALSDFKNKIKLLNIFPSLDTPVCSKSVHRFYEALSTVPNLVVANISCDLPTAAKRFCTQEQIAEAITLSTFRSSFSKDYGVEIAVRHVAAPEDDQTGFEFLFIGDKRHRHPPLCRIRADRRRK